jgi:hypothetical protein
MKKVSEFQITEGQHHKLEAPLPVLKNKITFQGSMWGCSILLENYNLGGKNQTVQKH